MGVFLWLLISGGFLVQLLRRIHDQLIVKTRFQIAVHLYIVGAYRGLVHDVTYGMRIVAHVAGGMRDNNGMLRRQRGFDIPSDLAEQLAAQAQDRHIPERQQFPRRP